MPITPADLLSFAETLASDPAEVSQRAAASRAYYGAYHSCLEIHQLIPHGTENGKGSHEHLIHDLLRFEGKPLEFRRNVNTIGELLRQARNVRTRADYRIEQDFPKSRAELAIELGRKLISRSKELLR